MVESASETDGIFSKDPLREADADEMFANNSSGKNQQKQQSTLTKTASKSSASLEERMNKFLEFQEKEREQEQQIENLRDIVETSPKYSKGQDYETLCEWWSDLADKYNRPLFTSNDVAKNDGGKH